MQTVITLLEAAAPDLLDRCLAVRQEVFTREMGVGTVWTGNAGTFSSPGTAGTSARCAVCPRRTVPCGSSGSASGRTAGDRAPDARPSPLWKTVSGRRGSRLWCWTPNVLPGASMRPAAMRRYPGSSWKPVCPMWQCAGHCDCFSAKKSLSPPVPGNGLFFCCYAAGFLPRSRARSRRRPVRTQPSTAPAKAPAVSMSTSRRLPSRPGTES